MTLPCRSKISAYETPSLIGFVQATVFTPDDKYLVTSDNDSTSVWDAQNGAYVFELAGESLGVFVITDGGRLFSAGFASGDVAGYTIYLDDAMALAREWVTRELTEQECVQYLRNADCEVPFGDG